MKFLSLFIPLFLLCSVANAQHNRLIKDQKRDIIIANLTLNAFVGGFGALINKRENQKVHKAFIKGFTQGLLGGTVQHWGKEISYQIIAQKNISYAWPSRIVHSIGSSIIYNAANNLNFWERYHLHLGPMIMRYDFTNKKFNARLNPINLAGVYLFGSQAKLAVIRSLSSGIMVFESDDKLTKFAPYPTDGLAAFSMFAINRNQSQSRYLSIFAHESLHVLQAEGQLIINPFFNKKDVKLKNRYRWYKSLSQYIELDLSSLSHHLLYQIQSLRPHHCRFSEREAHIYSNRSLLTPCN